MNLKKWKKIILASIVTIIVILAIIGAIIIFQNIGDVEVHLYVSNQSFDDNPVNITIKIDGKERFNRECRVDGQHNWTLVEFKLSKGSHWIKAIENDHGIEKKVSFSVHNEVWIVVDYWYYSTLHYNPTQRDFTIDFSNEPVYFM